MKRWIILLLASLTLFSCKDAKGPDVSGITADVQIFRTEKEIAAVNSKEGFDHLQNTHPAFYKLYLQKILPIESTNNADSNYLNFIGFVRDTLIVDLMTRVDKIYGDFGTIQNEVNQMYRYLKYYFPENAQIPNIYTFISEFGYQIFIFEDENGKDGIGIGLDMFLSPEIDYKRIDPDNTNFSSYITRSWNKDHIIKKITELHINDIVGEAPGHRLIDQMIHNGKSLYITKLLLPEVHDSIIMEYTNDQLNWCRENELQMWSFFLDQKLFFESNLNKIGKYVLPSPTSLDMPSESPGRTANYIGWQIIKEYMDRYPGTSLNELLEMKDSQELMQKSKYKPKQK